MDEKPISLEQTEAIIKGARLSGDGADFLRAIAACDDLKLYAIANTSDRIQFVLAKNGRYAKLISSESGHVHEPKNGRAFLIERPMVFRVGKKPCSVGAGFLSSAKRAMADQAPGVIEQRGNHAVRGDKVYSPLVGL